MGRVHVCLMGPGTDRSSLTAGAVCRETSGGGGYGLFQVVLSKIFSIRELESLCVLSSENAVKSNLESVSIYA